MDTLVYIGTYTDKGSEGIHLYELIGATGELVDRGLAAQVEMPTFLALHPSGRHLYSACDIEVAGKTTGGISAFSIENDGTLALLNIHPAGTDAPCHVAVTSDGRMALAANYGDGTFHAYPVFPDGTLGKGSAFVQHSGGGPNSRRQEGPHVHSVNPDPSARFALVADLGIDRIGIYPIDTQDATVNPDKCHFATLTPGAGPRHLTFHPNGRYVYVINELNSTITAFTYDADKGRLEEINTISTLPGDWAGENFTAEILVHPSGRFLYGSNRGHDSIVACRIDSGSGRIEADGHYPTQGAHPRNFGIDPSGRFLIAANMHSDTLVPFSIDEDTGVLTPTGQILEVSHPSCVRFLKKSPA